MKDTELRRVSELMKNSRRSDKELAKVLGISQPTVTRLRTRLEKEGVIKEYTMIPDFSRLGYTIMALTFIEHRKELDPKEKDEIVRMGVERARQEDTTETIMAERGMGLGYDAVVISYQKD
jgi:DNA-binding Lrp family transcriptional regulator